MNLLDLDRCLATLGWSDAELARRVGVTKLTMVRWRKSGSVPAHIGLWLEAYAADVALANELRARIDARHAAGPGEK
jgi:transcriptional regulator with XRE-family HTH domain